MIQDPAAVAVALRDRIPADRLPHVVRSLRHDPLAHRDPRARWYLQSYPVFLDLFRKTRGQTSVSAWVPRVAAVFSWIARIPTPDLNSPNLLVLTELETTHADAFLWDVGTASYLARQGDLDRLRHQGEVVFGTGPTRPPTLIRDFLEPANKLLNSSERWAGTLPTTTKLLHFMLPDLFPIMDTRICVALFGTHRYDYRHYHSYIFGLQAFLADAPDVVQVFRESGVSPVRGVEWALFSSVANEPDLLV